jgi:hypothetical protein
VLATDDGKGLFPVARQPVAFVSGNEQTALAVRPAFRIEGECGQNLIARRGGTPAIGSFVNGLRIRACRRIRSEPNADKPRRDHADRPGSA